MNHRQNAKTVDFEKIIQTHEFKSLVKRKKKFSTPYVIFFIVVFFIFLS